MIIPCTESAALTAKSDREKSVSDGPHVQVGPVSFVLGGNMTERNIFRRWYDCLFVHLKGSEVVPKKNSCAESFYLLISRAEATVLHNFLYCPTVTRTNEEWEVINKVAHALEKMLANK